jgi:hypothetical protein
MPPQNPVTRIERVARDLGRLAEEIESYAGPDAKHALRYWQDELRAAVEDLEHRSEAQPPG